MNSSFADRKDTDKATPDESALSFEERHWARIGTRAVDDFRVRALNRRILGLLARPVGSVLDIGCGSGVFSLEALQHSVDVMGIDISASQISVAREIFSAHSLSPDRLRCCSIQQIVSEGRRFNYCVALDVLEHIEDRQEFLHRVGDALLPGGQLVACVPAVPKFFDHRDELSGHYLRYTPEILRAELEAAGLFVKEIFYWNWLGWFIRTLEQPFRRGDEYDSYDFRYSEGRLQRLLNRALLTYFLAIENNLRPPIGMSLIARAQLGPA
jgi:SAM-dependent methyltransferase